MNQKIGYIHQSTNSRRLGCRITGTEGFIFDQSNPAHVGRVITRVCEVKYIKALQKIIIENIKSKSL